MIVTDVGGNPEAVADGAERLRDSTAQTPGAVAQALVRMQDAALRTAMGRASRARVEAQFSLEHMCAEHAQLYTALCGAAAAT